ncbi:MAG: GNAT family N-acetyltransferase [Ferruginibacter sp.]
MVSIIRAAKNDAEIIRNVGIVSFIESHGSSASAADIQNYVDEKFELQRVKNELSDAGNIFHIIYHDNEPAGYSKIIFNDPYQGSSIQNITKMERLYLLKRFYDAKLGLQLLNFNIDLCRQQQQAGMWLVVWTGNERAVRFYKKTGFETVAHSFFRISETHSNPNYEMLLKL